MWQDNVNGLFELTGGLFVLMNVIKLYRDKKGKRCQSYSNGLLYSMGLLEHALLPTP